MPKKVKINYQKTFIQSKRLVVRPYKLTDFKNCQSSHLGRLKNQGPYDEPIRSASAVNYSEFKKTIEFFRRIGKMQVQYIFGVFDRKNGELLGEVSLMVINKQMRWANLGYHIQNQYFKKGYATEACRLALKLAFKELGFHRVEAGTELKNKASKAVAKKIGMSYEGKRLKFFSHSGGVDMVFYGANAMDYK